MKNLKNIEYGKIEFNSYKKRYYYDNTSEVIGIYGQNGSGKTSVINALEILKLLISGESLFSDINEYIYQLSDSMNLNYVFYMNKNEKDLLIYYEVEITKDHDSFSILREKLSYKEVNKSNVEFEYTNSNKDASKTIENTTQSKTTILEIVDDNNKFPLLPQKRYNELIRYNKENEIDIQVTKKICKKNKSSFIFNEDTIDMFRYNSEYFNILNSLFYYSTTNLFIINSRHSANICLNFMPINFRFEESRQIHLLNGRNTNITRVESGNIPIDITKEISISKEDYYVINKVLDQMNIVLDKIIPKLEIELSELGKDFNEKGKELIKAELFSLRGDVKVPLRYESEGIKKIISILSTLISVFNYPSVCLAVDELDSGVFEFLLGEILEILKNHGKGQLIFTSHNLRALEKLSKENIVISTTNSKKRFKQITNVKLTNNLRDMYLRSIVLGAPEESIYDSTNSYEISHAFRKAGAIFGQK